MVKDDSPKRLDELVKRLPTFKATSKAAQGRVARDDESTIPAVHTIPDLTREVQKRLAPATTRKS